MTNLSIPGRILAIAWIAAIAVSITLTVVSFVRFFQGDGEAHAALHVAGRVAGSFVFLIPAIGVFEETFRAYVLIPLLGWILRIASGDSR